jgi:hypothetical protein
MPRLNSAVKRRSIVIGAHETSITLGLDHYRNNVEANPRRERTPFASSALLYGASGVNFASTS